MDIHEKTVRNMINSAGSVTILSNSNVESDTVRVCQICGRDTNSVNNYICEECRNGILKLLQENRYVDEKNPCEHAGVDYWYYPLTKEFYITLDEECSDKMFINYCPICGKKLPSYVFDIDVKEFED